MVPVCIVCTGVFPRHSFFIFFVEARFLPEFGVTNFSLCSWPACLWDPMSPPTEHGAFPIGSGALVSCPHTCMSSTLFSEPSCCLFTHFIQCWQQTEFTPHTWEYKHLCWPVCGLFPCSPCSKVPSVWSVTIYFRSYKDRLKSQSGCL